VACLLSLAQYTGVVARTRRAETPSAAAAAVASSTAVTELTSLHRQCKQQARQEAKFAKAKASKQSWLDWDQVQAARVRAVDACARGGRDTCPLELARDALLLTLLGTQPPDRVGITRLLRLGKTLKRTAGGFQLDLSEPGSHKTIGVTGPTCTTLCPTIARQMKHYLGLMPPHSVSNPYLFAPPNGDHSKPFNKWGWTRLVKTAFKRHSGMPLPPSLHTLNRFSLFNTHVYPFPSLHSSPPPPPLLPSPRA